MLLETCKLKQLPHTGSLCLLWQELHPLTITILLLYVSVQQLRQGKLALVIVSEDVNCERLLIAFAPTLKTLITLEATVEVISYEFNADSLAWF